MERKMRKTPTGDQCSILNGLIYFEDVYQAALGSELAIDILDDRHLRSVRVVSLSSGWFQNVTIAPGVKLREDLNLQMTIRKEWFGNLEHWYAYRRVFGTLHKRYVGHTEQLTEARLVAIAQVMPSL